MRDQPDLQSVVTLDVDLLAPMVVEELLAVKADELADEATVSVVRCGLDGDDGSAEKLGQFARAQRHFADYAEAAASAALQRPEEIGVGVHALAMRILPSAVTTSASSRPAAAVP